MGQIMIFLEIEWIGFSYGLGDGELRGPFTLDLQVSALNNLLNIHATD